MQSISLNSQLQLRNSQERVNVGLYFNLTLLPTEQHLLQTPHWCPLRCFHLGRICLEPSSLCLTFSSLFSSSCFFFTLLSERWLALPAHLPYPAEHVRHGENFHFSHLKVFSFGGNLLSSVSLDQAASLIMSKEHLAAPWVLAGVLHCTDPQRGPCPSAYSWCPGWGWRGG